MSPKYFKLAAQLLGLASDEFSNHGCNDFEKPDDWTQDEWDALSLEMYERNGDPENHTPGWTGGYDWQLMSHFAALLAEQGK